MNEAGDLEGSRDIGRTPKESKEKPSPERVLTLLKAYRSRWESIGRKEGRGKTPSPQESQELEVARGKLERWGVPYDEWLKYLPLLEWGGDAYLKEKKCREGGPPGREPGEWSILRIWPELIRRIDFKRPPSDPENKQLLELLERKRDLSNLGVELVKNIFG